MKLCADRQSGGYRLLEEEDIAVGGERGREMRNDVALRRSGSVVTVGHSEAQAAVQFLMKENGLLARSLFLPFFPRRSRGLTYELLRCHD